MARPRPLLTACAVAGFALSVAAPAEAVAATRFASPGGGGGTCPQSSPCDLRTAVEGANSSDVVLVASGAYYLTSNLAVPAGVEVDGPHGDSLPVVGGATGADPLLTVNPTATVRFLRLSQNDAAPALSAPTQATLDNLFVQRNTGGGAAAVVELGDASVLRDSVVWTHRGVSNVIGVLESPAVAGPNGSDLRNVTVSTQGSGSSALAALGTATGSATLTARNIIARGGPGGFDLLAAGNGVATAGTIDVGYSNYRGSATFAGSFGAISDAGANQTTVDPSFFDAAGADFHERPGSPTVDQGTAAASLTGALDLDGYPRSTGSAPDIGAYERPLPLTGATDSADGITATRATLHGTFDSQGRRARAYFQFGTGAGYGEQTVSRSYDAAVGSRSTSGGLVDLRPDHVYHYRLVAVSEGAVARGADNVFRTKQACVVPSLTRLTLSRARRALAHAHCALGRVTRPRSRTRRTLVVSGQRPGAESIRAVGTRVAVKLAPRR